jgi:dTDP-glucose 4,6-dehydratase
LLGAHRIDAIVNFAAESHVDRSIQSAVPFLQSNVIGVESLLAAARRRGIARFVQISTDEVYGSAPRGHAFSELDRLSPNNPYSASKAAADHLVRAYHVTHKLPACITRCTNNYGPFQFPEKFIPVVIASALAGRPIPVYGDGKYRREWLHVSDHCAGILKVLESGVAGETYNISDDIDITNIDVAHKILDLLGKPRTLIAHVTDRPGHDRCYRVDSRKIRRRLGWKPTERFERGLEKTVGWYVENRAWVKKVARDV